MFRGQVSSGSDERHLVFHLLWTHVSVFRCTSRCAEVVEHSEKAVKADVEIFSTSGQVTRGA
eukprot:4719682-Amphidinium_carterae.1